MLAPNYQAGRDALNGFKSTYKGEVLGEIYTKLDQSDFSVEIARIRALAPDAIYQFHPGGAGINFAKQYGIAGLGKTIPMLMPGFSMDRACWRQPATPARGLLHHRHLVAPPSTTRRTSASSRTSSRPPTGACRPTTRCQAYDTAQWIASALKAVGGDLTKNADFRAALRKADFTSLRGKFALHQNQHPVQDWYLLRIEPDASGKLGYKTVERIAADHVDPHAPECKM